MLSSHLIFFKLSLVLFATYVAGVPPTEVEKCLEQINRTFQNETTGEGCLKFAFQHLTQAIVQNTNDINYAQTYYLRLFSFLTQGEVKTPRKFCERNRDLKRNCYLMARTNQTYCKGKLNYHFSRLTMEVLYKAYFDFTFVPDNEIRCEDNYYAVNFVTNDEQNADMKALLSQEHHLQRNVCLINHYMNHIFEKTGRTGDVMSPIQFCTNTEEITETDFQKVKDLYSLNLFALDAGNIEIDD